MMKQSHSSTALENFVPELFDCVIPDIPEVVSADALEDKEDGSLKEEATGDGNVDAEIDSIVKKDQYVSFIDLGICLEEPLEDKVG